MQTTQLHFTPGSGWTELVRPSSAPPDAQLVLVFGERALLEATEVQATLRERFANAAIVCCSSGGEIAGDRALEGSVVATALHLVDTTVHAVEGAIPGRDGSAAAGEALVRRLPTSGLRHVLVFAEGLAVNGSALADGMMRGLPHGVSVTGGLAADGDQFGRTGVGLDGPPGEGRVVAVGLYGDRLRVGMGTLGGWELLEPSWTVTRADGSVVYELDGEPALAVYKRHIGAHAYALPASGLLYPLQLENVDGGQGVARTLLGMDAQAGSLTFAGDVPQGCRVRLLGATLDQLIAASGDAATASLAPLLGAAPEFVLLVSCIGRKLLLQQRVTEEIRSARRAFGPEAALAGFYSYGELSPMTASGRCELHNQTMTITTLSER